MLIGCLVHVYLIFNENSFSGNDMYVFSKSSNQLSEVNVTYVNRCAVYMQNMQHIHDMYILSV